jgi:uncharacterized protein with von Willebrand factor type A (vWA) domain
MATPGTAAPAPSKATGDKYESLVAGLSPENRVAFRQANLARVQAEAAYKEAKHAAEDEERKPERAFNAAKAAYDAAEAQLTGSDGAVKRAGALLLRLRQEAGETVDLVDPERPNAGKEQIAKLQATLDEYKASVLAVAAQMQAVDAAALALQKLSEPQRGKKFDPTNPELNKMAELIAKEQKELALAQAQIPLDAARDAFALKQAELAGSQPRRIQ